MASHTILAVLLGRLHYLVASHGQHTEAGVLPGEGAALAGGPQAQVVIAAAGVVVYVDVVYITKPCISHLFG